MNPFEEKHSFFRLVVRLFSIYMLFLFATGFWTYAWQGLHPADTLERYAGSETMQKTYPDRPDHFKRPRTIVGLAKYALGHLGAYGILCFILAHLVRSLRLERGANGMPSVPRSIDRFSYILFAAATLDVIAPISVRYGPSYFAHVRLMIFFLFNIIGFSGFLYLFYLCTPLFHRKNISPSIGCVTR